MEWDERTKEGSEKGEWEDRWDSSIGKKERDRWRGDGKDELSGEKGEEGGNELVFELKGTIVCCRK